MINVWGVEQAKRGGLGVGWSGDLPRFTLTEFRSLIAFLLLSWSFGVKAAIVDTVTFVLIDVARGLWDLSR